MSGSLIVLGGTGAVGRAVVDRALATGRQVIAVAREPADLAALRAAYGPGAPLRTLDATIASDGDAANLATRLRALAGPAPSGVIAAIRGNVERGRLLDGPAEFLRRRLDEDLLPHLFAARHLLPLLAAQPRAGYVLVGGPGADQPWAGYGHHSIGASALRMLARVLHDEARTLPVRVQMLAIDTPIRTAANARHACDQWPAVDAIARRALELLDTHALPAQPLVRFERHDAAPTGNTDDVDVADAPCRAKTPDSHVDARALDDARSLLQGLLTAPSLQDPARP